MKIKYGATPSGSRWEDELEVPDEEWDDMTPSEREELLDDLASQALAYSCDSWAYVEED